METTVRKDDKNAVFTDITKSRKALVYDIYDFRKVPERSNLRVLKGYRKETRKDYISYVLYKVNREEIFTSFHSRLYP